MTYSSQSISDYPINLRAINLSFVPLKSTQHIEGDKGHSHCCYPVVELDNVSFSSDLNQTPLMIHDEPPILTANTWREHTHLSAQHTATKPPGKYP